jgi:hypothetical protein
MIEEKKKPPLVKAAREFIVGAGKNLVRKKIGNKDLALLSHALLAHAKGISDGAEEVTSSPSEQQLADLMWCSPRDVRRAILRAKKSHMLTIKRRGDGMSSLFTLHRKPISDRTAVGHSDTEVRPDNSPRQTGQTSVSERTKPVSDRTTFVSDRTTVGHLRGEASGVDLQGQSPSGVDLQVQSAEPKSKTAPCPSSSEDQNQKPKRKLTDGQLRYAEVQGSREITEPAKWLSELFGLAGNAVVVARQVIAQVVTKNDCSIADAISAIENRIARDKASGLSKMDFSYLVLQIAKLRVSEELAAVTVAPVSEAAGGQDAN